MSSFILLLDNNNQFRNNQFQENSRFVVLELFVGSGEQDINELIKTKIAQIEQGYRTRYKLISWTCCTRHYRSLNFKRTFLCFQIYQKCIFLRFLSYLAFLGFLNSTSFQARTDILKKSLFFLVDLKTPKILLKSTDL